MQAVFRGPNFLINSFLIGWWIVFQSHRYGVGSALEKLFSMFNGGNCVPIGVFMAYRQDETPAEAVTRDCEDSSLQSIENVPLQLATCHRSKGKNNVGMRSEKRPLKIIQMHARIGITIFFPDSGRCTFILAWSQVCL